MAGTCKYGEEPSSSKNAGHTQPFLKWLPWALPPWVKQLGHDKVNNGAEHPLLLYNFMERTQMTLTSPLM